MEKTGMEFCESSSEFDLYEEMRRNLSRALADEGHDRIKAERVALYVVQGLRDMPKLLNALSSGKAPASEITELLDGVLANAPSLVKAHALLHGLDAQDEESGGDEKVTQ